MFRKFNENRFKTITFGAKYSNYEKQASYEFVVVPHKMSINVEEEMFTNFLSQHGGDLDQIEALKRINEEIRQNKLNENEFDRRELVEVKGETDRIIRIINSYGIVHINSICEVFKCKYRKMPKVQVYINLCDNKLQIVLIDVHHLGLSGDFSKQVKFNRAKCYCKNKKKNKCISEFLTV